MATQEQQQQQQHQEETQLPPSTSTSRRSVPQMLQEMTLDDKIGQMAQIEMQMLTKTHDKSNSNGNNNNNNQEISSTVTQLDMEAVEEWIGRRGIGSVLNNIPYWTAEQYRQAMIQINRVATKYNRPPVIWGLDSIHGANYIHKAVVTPQPLNIAATFNETVSYQAGKLASRDTRAAGINWLFSPLLGLALSPRWSRVFETFGEDPLLVGKMAAAMIRGIQEPDSNASARPRQAAACAKHFIGYSAPRNGHDRSPSWIPTRHLYQYFVPPWQRVLLDDDKAAAAMTVMESFSETDGVPVVASPHHLQYLLRQRLNFTGVLVTDYAEMRHLYLWHKTADSLIAASQQAIRRSSGSVDMSMLPFEFDEFHQAVTEGLQTGMFSEQRINESVQRILQLKSDLGMMMIDDKELQMDDPNLALIGTDQELAMDMVRQSIVLTKNDNNTLPLVVTKQQPLKILVTGPTVNSRVYQSGAWTGRWQGVRIDEEDYGFTYGSSLKTALMNEPLLDVTYACGVDILGNTCTSDDDDDSNSSNKTQTPCSTSSIECAVNAASLADVVVIAVGQESTTEKQGDIRSLDLALGQYELVRKIRKSIPKSTKIVLVFFGGRPRLLHDMVDQSDAVFVAFLPGPSSGEALVDMMLGRVNPNGRLPITYPKYDDGGGLPYYHAVSDQCTRGRGVLPHWEFLPCPVEWPFGHGLSYTTFEYSDFSASGGIDQDLQLSITVRNTGDVSGSETVLFFTFDEFRSTTPEYKRLRAFDKVYLEPGQQILMQAMVPLEELKFVGADDDTHYILDPTMKSWAGVGAWTDCRVHPQDNALCVHLQSDNPSREYVGACEAACKLWSQSGCLESYGLSSDEACLELCTLSSRSPVSSAMEHDGENQAWSWNYVRCLESVLFHSSTFADDDNYAGKRCRKLTVLCRDIFEAEPMNEKGNAVLATLKSLKSAPFVKDYGSLALGVLIGWLLGWILFLRKNGTAKASMSPRRFKSKKSM